MKKSLQDRILVMFSWCCALLLATGFMFIVGFLVVKGYRGINLELIFADTRLLDAFFLKRQVFGGLFPAIIGTLSLILLSIGFALPLGLASGIFLAEYASPRLKSFFSLMVDILAGIPSIVVGLFGFSITIFLHHFFSSQIFPCLLISALSLAFLILPYIIKTTQVAIESLPLQVRLTAPSLGATKLENIIFVLLPSALSDIVSGIVLAIGRCAEDTAVIMLTGVVATAGVPRSVFSNFEALPFYIYYIASEYSNSSELMKGYGAALILLLISAGLFALAHWIKLKIEQKTRFGY
ncbi:MAG: phosphate ABC transporter permease PstA [Desulfobacula sp.]|jgi:phosphate transport system permease protein|uniref:phosphate ABC transporter permease PstA n=1 Tax=Desulfobacula sp. TaxID=2593537 RepID=UPI001DFCA726|nr:phosphate ABC transporter permease PstA [Desulfobacula sp.]MBT3483901.1 phosphate ABC transporter permease PstA [Desulfobacula sp.]MBT3803912.1 phosphate ABC transporter permease PstA [Desulfobacula sp.]MBT4023857.1 phosphate ABC transporter permease PstA [Desulfobacula sp.]MBT4197583.1 phosphate ABC transporter permease PstA [Desulfobacula sp.]